MWSLAKVQQRVDRTAQIRLPFTYSIIEGNPKRIEGRPLRTLDAAAAALPLLLSRRCNSLRVLTRGCHPNVAACYIESFTSFSHVDGRYNLAALSATKGQNFGERVRSKLGNLTAI